MYVVCKILFFICPFLFLELVQYHCTKSATLKETYVSPMEKSIHVLIESIQKFDRKFLSVKEDSHKLLNDLSSPKDVHENATENSTVITALDKVKSKIKVIFPGTYWCGEGNVSSKEGEVGIFEKADECCKQHDHCPDSIPAEKDKDGLINNGIFTRSSCECDNDFYQCLKQANNSIASNIGRTYFNLLRPQCFKEYYPIQFCVNYTQHWMSNKCVQYIYNEKEPKEMQWFDNPDF